jgi:hypothetical protein
MVSSRIELDLRATDAVIFHRIPLHLCSILWGGSSDAEGMPLQHFRDLDYIRLLGQQPESNTDRSTDNYITENCQYGWS